MSLPSPQAPVVDDGGKITPVWFRWLSELRGNADAGASQADMDAAIAAIATALGSPDGTVANIPPQSEANIRLLQGAGIAITGDAVNGYTIALRPLADSGAGALLGITRDAYGRVSGTTDATITGTAGEIDVANGDAVAGPPTLSLADVADAGGGTLQKTAFDAKGRKTGTSAATAADLPIADAGGYFTGTDVEAALQELGAGGGGGASAFTDLTDAPTGYSGAGGYGVAVKAAEDGLEFVPLTGSGTVTSVGVTNTGGGLTITGSPVTGAGNINVDPSAATIASLALADTAVQPGDLAAVATSGNASDVAYSNATSGLTATDVQAAIDEVAASGGGGGIDHTTDFEVFEDFTTPTGTRWTDENGSGGAHTYLSGEANAPGIVRSSISSASSTGRACQKIGTTQPILVGGGQIVVEQRMRHNTLPTATDNTLTIFGLSNVINAGTFTDRIYAQYTHNGTAAVWSITDQAAGGAVTGTTSATGAVSGTWQTARLIVNAAATSVDLVVDGVTVLTRPLSGTFGPMTAVRRFSWVAGGLSHTMDTDYISVRQAFTTAR